MQLVPHSEHGRCILSKATFALPEGVPRGSSWPKLTATKQLQCLRSSIRVLCQAATSQHELSAVDAEALQALVKCTIPDVLLKVGSCCHRHPDLDG